MAENLLVKLGQIHRRLQKEFANDAATNRATAIELEKFLNYVIYGQSYTISSGKQTPLQEQINNLVGNRGIELLRHHPEIQKLRAAGQAQSANQKGIIAENAVGRIMLQMLKETISSKDNQRKIDAKIEALNSGSTDSVVVGHQMATIINNEVLTNYYNELQQNLGSTINIEEYFQWQRKQGKIDVNMGIIDIDIQAEESILVRELLNVTASVKNYAELTVKLENVNKEKAYTAIIAKLYPEGEAEANKAIYKSYRAKDKNSKNAQSIDLHMEHLANLYALTGFGQTYVTDNGLISDYAR